MIEEISQDSFFDNAEPFDFYGDLINFYFDTEIRTPCSLQFKIQRLRVLRIFLTIIYNQNQQRYLLIAKKLSIYRHIR